MPLDELGALVKQLHDLCVSSDQEYISQFSSTISGQTQSLFDAAEFHSIKLERRLESWSIFPVKEAKVVQEFISEATDELQDDIQFDKCDTEELEDVLQRLEVMIVVNDEISIFIIVATTAPTTIM